MSEKEKVAGWKEPGVKMKNKRKWDRIFFMGCFLVVPMLNFLIFYLYTNINSFLMAFERPVYSGDRSFKFSLANFTTIINNFSLAGGKVLLQALRNTLMYYVSGIVIGLPISILMCYFIYKKIPGYKLYRIMMYLPNVITATALAVLFRYAVGTGGVIDALCEKTGKEFFYIFSRDGWANFGLLFYSLSFGFGVNMIVLGGAMNSINTEMLEAAQIDGCNWFQELWRIIVPTIWPTVGTIIILSTAGCLGSTGPVLLFTKGDWGTMTLSYYIYALVSGIGGTQDLYLASAVGFLMTIVSFPLALVVKKVVYGKEV